MKKYFHLFVVIYSLFYLTIILSHRNTPRKYKNIRSSKFKSRTLQLERNLVRHVDVFYGTGTISAESLSTGNLYPIISRPFGNNHWTVTSNGKSPWLFNRDSNMFNAIRCSHQPSVWIGDHSYFDIMADDKPVRYLKYEMTPSVMHIGFDNSQISLVPTETGAIVKFTGEINVQLRHLQYNIRDEHTIVGIATDYTIFKPPPHTVLHVVIKTSNRITGNKLKTTNNTEWRVGTSFINKEEAFNNIPHVDFDSLLSENNIIWNKALGKILIEESDTEKVKKFYTILYRTLLYPRSLKEPSGKHYSPYSNVGDIFTGELSTASGFWDAYRTVYPLLHLVYPEYASKILNGWVNAIKESPDNMLAQWASPAKVNSMEGAMGEISIAEGIMNNAIDDVDTAWSYLYRSCFTSAGRESFDIYKMLGYVPNQVSLSLNYYLSDYVVSLVARKLGHIKAANVLLERSTQWKLLFDKHDTKFFRPMKNKKFVHHFEEFKWMGPYREGGPWQYRFYVPHDPETLNEWGYENQMCKYLRKMMQHKYEPINDRGMIHEEKELYSHMFGQYAHNNQPVHHILYLFQHVGCGNEGQEFIRHTLENSYMSTGFPGDEDNGEMSAWYILSSLGLYSLVPGSLKYQIGATPLFKYISIDNGRIIIENDENKQTWQSVVINNEYFEKELVYLHYDKENKYRIVFQQK